MPAFAGKRQTVSYKYMIFGCKRMRVYFRTDILNVIKYNLSLNYAIKKLFLQTNL